MRLTQNEQQHLIFFNRKCLGDFFLNQINLETVKLMAMIGGLPNWPLEISSL